MTKLNVMQLESERTLKMRIQNPRVAHAIGASGYPPTTCAVGDMAISPQASRQLSPAAMRPGSRPHAMTQATQAARVAQAVSAGGYPSTAYAADTMTQATQAVRVALAALLTAALAVVLCVAPATHAPACEIPVCQYALENWDADHYEVVVFHRGLSGANRDALALLNAAANREGGNLEVYPVDLAAPDPIMLQRWRELKDASTPWMAVYYPRAGRLPRLAWAGAFSADSVHALLDSPLRRKIGSDLLGRTIAAWVLLESGNRGKDNAAAALLEKELRRLEETLALPVLDGWGQTGTAREPLQVKFTLYRLSRDDPDEQMLVDMLLHSEPDLTTKYAREPLAFPIYGRGLILYALVGAGINPWTISEAASFVTGPCSCEVKAGNPGTDMLLTLDWDAHVTRTAYETLPPPTGMASFRDRAAEAERRLDEADRRIARAQAAQADTGATKRAPERSIFSAAASAAAAAAQAAGAADSTGAAKAAAPSRQPSASAGSATAPRASAPPRSPGAPWRVSSRSASPRSARAPRSAASSRPTAPPRAAASPVGPVVLTDAATAEGATGSMVSSLSASIRRTIAIAQATQTAQATTSSGATIAQSAAAAYIPGAASGARAGGPGGVTGSMVSSLSASIRRTIAVAQAIQTAQAAASPGAAMAHDAATAHTSVAVPGARAGGPGGATSSMVPSLSASIRHTIAVAQAIQTAQAATSPGAAVAHGVATAHPAVAASDARVDGGIGSVGATGSMVSSLSASIRRTIAVAQAIQTAQTAASPGAAMAHGAATAHTSVAVSGARVGDPGGATGGDGTADGEAEAGAGAAGGATDGPVTDADGPRHTALPAMVDAGDAGGTGGMGSAGATGSGGGGAGHGPSRAAVALIAVAIAAALVTAVVLGRRREAMRDS
jgi:hypothetical protein